MPIAKRMETGMKVGKGFHLTCLFLWGVENLPQETSLRVTEQNLVTCPKVRGFFPNTEQLVLHPHLGVSQLRSIPNSDTVCLELASDPRG